MEFIIAGAKIELSLYPTETINTYFVYRH